MMKKIINPWSGNPKYNCFGCSPNNPFGLHMEFYEDGDYLVKQMRNLLFIHAEITNAAGELCVVPFVYFSARVIKSVAVSHSPCCLALAHSLDDMGIHQFRQLPLFIGSIRLLNC